MLPSTSRQAREQRAPRCIPRAPLSCLISWAQPSLFVARLGRAGAVPQPPQSIADAATDLLRDKLPPHLPKLGELAPARYPILSAAPSSKEPLVRESADRYCLNRTAVCL